MSKRFVPPEATPEAHAGLEAVMGSPGEALLSTPQYMSLIEEVDEETMVPVAAKEALMSVQGDRSAYGNSRMPGIANESHLTTNIATQEALTRQSLYTTEEKVYPRTNPNVTSFSAFEIPPTEATGSFQVDVTPASKVRRYNSFDEGQRLASCACWWTDSEDRVQMNALCPRMPVPPEPISIPPLGFPRLCTDATYKWNNRYLSILNSRAGKEREEAAATFVKEFCDEVVPILNFVLSNLTSLPSPILHCRGITIEVLGKAPHIASLFEGDRSSSYKTASREYHARIAAQRLQLPQLVIPFTIMVELYGAKAIAYPRTPLAPRPQVGPSAPQEGLAYGVRSDFRQFHTEFLFYGNDVEAESVARQLAKGLRAKPKFIGREFSSLQCSYTPMTFTIHRSPHDNRLYAGQLLHLMSPTINTETAFCNEYYVNTFRPEFAEKFQTEPLSFESCTHLQVVGKDADELARAATVQMLLTYVIPQAAQQFSRDVRLWGIGWPLLERGGLSRFMHSWGINMRYLVEFRNALKIGSKHSQAKSFVEIELVARALKSSVLRNCNLYAKEGIAYPHEISNHLRRIVTGVMSSLWESDVWPAVIHKYPLLTPEAWSPSRVDWKKCVERLLALLGAQVRTNRVATAAGTTSRVVYAPIVHVPPFPAAPYGDGESLNLTLRARRYLRGVVAGTVTESAKQQALLCVQLLQSGPEAGCEELMAYVAAESKRKEKLKGRDGEAGERRLGIKADFTNNLLTTGSYNHFISLKDREGKLLFDPSDEGLSVFGFRTQQRLQITLGAQKGKRSQVIGVRGGHMWRADAGADQPVECTGKNHMELMMQYGFVSLDQEDCFVEEPYLLPGEDTILIFEQSRSVVEGRYGFAPGQQVLLKSSGPLQGVVTTIMGTRNGILYHFPSNTIGYPMPLSIEAVDTYPVGRASFTSYPIESTALDSYTGSSVGDYFIGFKVTTPFGYHYRQVLHLRRGLYKGRTAFVLGVRKSCLWAILDYGEVVALGDIKSAIDIEHQPRVAGLMSEDWRHSSYMANTVFYPTLGGEPITLSTADSDILNVADLMLGTKLTITGGHKCGEVAAVVGVRKGRIWVQFDGVAGGTPLGTDSYVAIKGSISDVPIFEEGGSYIPALSPCGTIIPICIDIPSSSCFGLFHGQQIEIERFEDHEGRLIERWKKEWRGRWSENQQQIEDTLFATAPYFQRKSSTTAVVVGTYRHQLWVQREGCAFVWPLRGYTAWEVRHYHGNVSVTGLASPAPWSDNFMFVTDLPMMTWTSFDHLYRAEDVSVFTLKSGEPVGLLTTEDATAPFKIGDIIQRRAVSNFVEDSVHISPTLEGTTRDLRVAGGWDGVVYVEEYIPSEKPSGVVKPLIDPEAFERTTKFESQPFDNQSLPGSNNASSARPVEPFLKQLGITAPPSETASEGTCFALMNSSGSLFQAVPQNVVARATNFEHPETLIYTDQGTYNFETMSYRQYIVDFSSQKADQASSHEVREEVYAIARINVFTATSVLAGLFGILPQWGSALVETVEGIASALIDPKNEFNRSYAAKILHLKEKAYFEDDVELWKETLAECVSELLILDLETEGVDIPAATVAEFKSMHQNLPSKGLHGCCAYVLSLIGCDEASVLYHYSLDQCIRMVLVVVKRCTGKWLGAVLTSEEYRAHLHIKTRQLEKDEIEARTDIENQRAMFIARLRVGPRFSSFDKDFATGATLEEAFEGDQDHWIAADDISTLSGEADMGPDAEHCLWTAKAARSEPWRRISRVRAEINSLYSHKKDKVRKSILDSQSSALAGRLAPTETFRFTQSDASILYLQSYSSSHFPSFRRGDVVRYSVGDLCDMVATILGTKDGQLWRCEHSGPFEGVGLPFEGTEKDIQMRFNPIIVPTAKTEVDVAPRLICGNVSNFLTWHGQLQDFDVSHESCFVRYGVVVGQRFQATRSTPTFFPFRDSVIVIIGVYNDRLWFICDDTGAMPFPLELSNPIYTLRLRLLYTAPIHSNPTHQFVKAPGSLTDRERQFLRDPGAHSLIFNTSPALLSLFKEGLLHGRKVLITDNRSDKVKRATIVGLRHAKVWGLVEYDSFAIALPSNTVYLPSLEEEQMGKVSSLPPPKVAPITTRRYPIPRGGLGVFSLDDTSLQFGINPGQLIEWGAGPTRTLSLILGVRNGALWRIDDGEDVARPFQGRLTRTALAELNLVSKGEDQNRIRIRPW